MTNDIITQSCVQICVCAATKADVLRHISQIAALHTGIDSLVIQDALEHRENLGSTGMGRGIAIPHAKFDSLEKVVAFFFRLESPVDFCAMDAQEVDIIFLMLAPANNGAEHLKVLSRISRLLRDETTTTNLRLAVSSEQAFKIIAERM